MTMLSPVANQSSWPGLGRPGIMVAVILLHLLILFGLLTMKGLVGDRRLDRPLAVSLLPDMRPPLSARRRLRSTSVAEDGSQSGPERREADSALPLIASPAALETPIATGNGMVKAAGDAGQGDKTGPGGAGLGSGSGGPDRGQGAVAGTAIPAMTSPPGWVHQISNEELLPLLSKKVRRSGVDVSLLLSCEIMLTKRVRDCRLMTESPAGTEVGGIIEQASRYFRVEPARHGDASIDGERVNILWNVHIVPGRTVETDLPLSLR